jgi:ligand-binding sensor domain-containing protein
LLIAPDNPEVLLVGTEGAGLYRLRPDNGRYDLVGDETMAQLYVKQVVASADNSLYVVSTDGLFLVDGNSGYKIEGLPDGAVSLAVDPANSQHLYVGTVGYGLYHSEDGGRDWQALNAGLGWQPGIIMRVPTVAVDQDNPDHLSLSLAYGVGNQVVGEGVYESFNGGQHWVKIANTNEVVTQILLEEGGIYVATAKGLSRYGNPLSASWLGPSLQFNSLANPTGVQVLILILTLALASWVLLGHLNWIPGYQRSGL